MAKKKKGGFRSKVSNAPIIPMVIAAIPDIVVVAGEAWRMAKDGKPAGEAIVTMGQLELYNYVGINRDGKFSLMENYDPVPGVHIPIGPLPNYAIKAVAGALPSIMRMLHIKPIRIGKFRLI